jgi:hypothetical protein
MLLESLPGELLLLIFSYLHRFHIIYGFTNLNRRFERFVYPYVHDIDLTEHNSPSYRIFSFFLKHIISTQGQHIRSLKLSGCDQLKFFRPHIRRLVNLESLIIKNDQETDYYYVQQLNNFVVEALSIPTLSKLTICPSGEDVLTTISSSSTLSKLTSLTLIYPFGLLNLNGVSQMPNIKSFSVTLPRVATIIEIFKVMPNLIELNISSVNLYGSANMNGLKVPNTLQKLHLEYGRYQRLMPLSSFETLKMFLDRFKDQLRSLTVIAIDADDDFANFEKFQSLVLNFTRLETFQYYIRTGHKPDWPSLFPNVEQLPDSSYSIFTQPKPQNFDTISEREKVNCSDINLQQLFYCHTLSISKSESSSQAHSTTFEPNDDNLKLIKLQNIQFIDLIEHFAPNILRSLRKVKALSPNLISLEISTRDTEQLIKSLGPPDRRSHQIIHLQLSIDCSDNYHRIFFSKLSQIFPNLKELKICGSQPVPFDCITSLTEFIDHLRNCFRNLSHLILEIWLLDAPIQSEYYEKELEKLRTVNSLDFTTTGSKGISCLNIWL